jgi:hypothetical protein
MPCRFGKRFEANPLLVLFMDLMCQADVVPGSGGFTPFLWKRRGEDLVRRRITKRRMKMRLEAEK